MRILHEDNVEQFIEEKPYRPIICVDFDGVLNKYDGWRGKLTFAPPVEDAVWFLRELRNVPLDWGLETEARVVLLTARSDLEECVEWLRFHMMSPYLDAITRIKLPAWLYIDDRAVLHDGSFRTTLGRARTFVPHWKTPTSGM